MQCLNFHAKVVWPSVYTLGSRQPPVVASNTVRVKFLEIPSRVPARAPVQAGFEVKVKDVWLFVRV